MKLQNKYIPFSLLILAFFLFLLPISAPAAPPSGAVKFVILKIKPKDSQVGTPVTITIEAQAKNNKVDTSYQNDVTLVASGSATGAGFVDIANGVGSLQINDLAVETVILSLSDTQLTGLDVSSTGEINFVNGAPESESEPGGGAIQQRRIVFSGQAYPGSKVEIMLKSNIDILFSAVPAEEYYMSDYGAFHVTYIGSIGNMSTGGNYFFGLRAEDKDGRKTLVRPLDLKVIGNQIITENIFMPPTVGLLRGTVRKGDYLTVLGYGEPTSAIEIELDGKIIKEEAKAGDDGFYKALIKTSELSFGEHSIRTRQKWPNIKESDFSLKKTFSVSELFVPETDFNNDDKIDISDLSIFLSRWKSENKEEKMTIDLNEDGKIDISDFSKFLRTIKK